MTDKRKNGSDTKAEKGNHCFSIKQTGFINNGYNLRHLKTENKGRGTNSLSKAERWEEAMIQFGFHEGHIKGDSGKQLCRVRWGLSSRRAWRGSLHKGQQCVAEAFNEQSDSGRAVVVSSG